MSSTTPLFVFVRIPLPLLAGVPLYRFFLKIEETEAGSKLEIPRRRSLKSWARETIRFQFIKFIIFNVDNKIDFGANQNPTLINLYTFWGLKTWKKNLSSFGLQRHEVIAGSSCFSVDSFDARASWIFSLRCLARSQPGSQTLIPPEMMSLNQTHIRI